MTEAQAGSKSNPILTWRLLALGLSLVLGLGAYASRNHWPGSQPEEGEDIPGAVRLPPALTLLPVAYGQDGQPTQRAPELEGGVGWLNTAGPISLRDLRGKIVVLDFWTLCCINCIHTLPDLAKLEKKYANQVVVIGVHSAKFDNEKNSESIRKAILRYEISHPVVNDANMKIWRAYGVQSWPTLVVIDPEGLQVGKGSGEGLYDSLDDLIRRLIAYHKSKKTLNEEPLRFDLARFRERGDSPLFFPGKVLADAANGRIFIADSTHHRIVITDLTGKKIAVAGQGYSGKADGPFDQARFNDPQGMALDGDTLYVADRKNHLIRALDLKANTVKTMAGTGEQGQERRRGGGALETGLNSPWDLYLRGRTLYIAMAGHHQIWTLDLKEGKVAPFAGTGQENINDAAPDQAAFAQPSGLTSDGNKLYVADSEVSAIRAVPLDGRGDVESLVGEGLFEFGDVDGVGPKVRLQHALGVAFHDGKLYVADTYNSKIKVIDPKSRSCTTYLSGKDKGWLTGSPLNEPGGLSIAADKMYIADTNNHRICVVDLKTKAVSTLALQGVAPPEPPPEASTPVFPNPSRKTLASETVVPPEGELNLAVELNLPQGSKLNPEARMTYQVETLPGAKAAWSQTGHVNEAKTTFRIGVPVDKMKESKGLRLSLVYYECGQGSLGICRVKSQIWDVPLKFDEHANNRVIHLSGPDVTK